MLLLSSLTGNSQNYYEEFPINTIVSNNGSQFQLICSTYDSTIQSTVTYTSPWINYLIIVSGSTPGKVVFSTWVNPGQQHSEYGFIVYDYLLHQFAVNWIQGTLASSQRILLGSSSKWFAEMIESELSTNNYTFKYKYYTYHLQSHTWATVSFPYPEYSNSPNWGGSIYAPNSNWIYFIEDTDEGIFHYYDARSGGIAGFYSGCAGWGFGISDDYFYMDTGCLDNYRFASYDAGSGGFYGYPREQLLGGMYRGIFTASDQNDFNKKFVFVQDEFTHQWLTDSIEANNFGGLVLKDRVVAYINETIGYSKKVFYMVHNPLLHTWVKDSTVIAGTAVGLVIENGTVKWTDSNGLNIRGYDINLGWGNYLTPLFLYFNLVDLSSQGQSMVHVRNYSIGTDNVYFDMGDGTISAGNSLWRHYRDSGSYTICIYDSSGANSYCQQVNMNICSSSGTMSLSNDTICQGDTVVLSLNNYQGSIQWQSRTTGSWVDETGPGATTDNYSIVPSKSTTYRAVVTNGICTSVYSNSQFLKVHEYISNALISDSLLTSCSGQNVAIFVLNVNATYQWQQNTGSGWSNINNATSYGYASSPTSNILYRAIISSGNCFMDTSSLVSVIVDSVPTLPVTVPNFTCGPGVVNLQATSTGTIYWYEYYITDSIIHTGNTYSPFISSNTNYRVRSTNGLEATAGYSDNSIGNVGSMSNEQKGLRFYCAEPATLTAVYVYILQPGVVQIRLYDAHTGQYVSNTVQNITGGIGKTKIEWNNVSLKGNRTYDMKIEASSVPLEINTSGISFPITTSGNPITILGYVDSLFHDTADFYNIYDITLSTGCQSNLVSVQGSVYPEFNNAAIAPNGPLVFCQGDSVKFSTSPIGSFTFQWLKNGLPIGSTGNTYTAKTAGTYQVIMNNSSGCVDTSSAKNVRVPCMPTFDPVEKSMGADDINSFQFNILYNSDNEELNIKIFSNSSGIYNMKIIDQSGREVINVNEELSAGEHKLSYTVHTFSNGIYVVKMEGAQTRALKKFVKY